MAFLFKSKAKSPSELVKGTKELFLKLDSNDKKSMDKVNEEISKLLSAMKGVLYGDGGRISEPAPELVSQLAQEVYNADLFELFVDHFPKLEFEARKDVAQIFNNLLRRQIGARAPTVEYLCSKEAIILKLMKGYENQEIALNCGLILRECLRHESLAKFILYSTEFKRFFEYVDLLTFDIASDAFATFKDILTKHKSIVAEYLQNNYDEFFENYSRLLASTNYVTKRQSLKLLGELLLDRSNFDIMTKYIANAENLKSMMNLLREKSRNIQYEAFHVFKVFVANPNKSKPILDILIKNQEKLISFLSNFHNDRTEDEQFNDEKAFLIKQIQALK